MGSVVERRNIPLSKVTKATPEENGQEDHKEGMCAEVGRDRKVAIQRRGAHRVLDKGEVGRLPPHEGEQALAEGVSPFREGSFVCYFGGRLLVGVPGARLRLRLQCEL